MMAGFKKVWYEGLACKLGLVCLTKDEDGKPIIAAMNCTTVTTKNDKADISKVGIEQCLVQKLVLSHFRKFQVEYLKH